MPGSFIVWLFFGTLLAALIELLSEPHDHAGEDLPTDCIPEDELDDAMEP